MAVAWSIGGTAGEGLETAGEVFAAALASMGYAPTTGRDFPSRIRGGDTTYTVRLSPDGFLAPAERVDVAMAFNETVLPRMQARLDDDSLLLVDDGIDGGTPFPFTALAKEAGKERAKNMVAVGASAAILGIDLDGVAAFVAERFAKKGDDVVAVNRAALEAGHAAASGRFGVRVQAPMGPTGPALFISGNQAFCLGALAAGCTVAAGYPITPASDILEFLTPRLEGRGVAIQVEDEMAALNVVIGAGFAGARAMTATSGPGLSLMTETMGLAGATETPAVIVDCQRPGPSTGMPTKHGQEDLWHMVHGGHGEYVRVVLAPMDVADAFSVAGQAFHAAETWSCPVFVALDQQCSLMKQTVGPFDAGTVAAAPRGHGSHDAEVDAWAGTYRRYGGDGQPARPALPGERGGVHYANSTEHGPDGFTNEHPGIRTAMVDRRLQRMRRIVEATEDAVVAWGPVDADTVVVSWGSTVGACREAAARASRPVRVVAIRLLWPFPKAAVAKAIGDAQVIVAEANGMAQLSRLLRSELPVHDRLTEVLRYDGTPVRASDVLEAVEAR